MEHSEILYLDDFAENIAAAESFGWSTIHVTDPASDVARIDRFLTTS